MRICWLVAAVAFMSFSMTSVALFADDIERQGPEIDLFASMTGKCSTLRIVERDFSCTTVAFSHSPGGRSGFTVPLNDPDDDSHIITFSGEKSNSVEIQGQAQGRWVAGTVGRAVDGNVQADRKFRNAAGVERRLHCHRRKRQEISIPV